MSGGRGLCVLAVTIALSACYTYHPIALADVEPGDRVRVESKTGVAFGPAGGDEAPFPCRALRLEGDVRDGQVPVLTLQERRPARQVDSTRLECLALGHATLTVSVRDSAVQVKRRALGQARTAALLVTTVVVLFSWWRRARALVC